MGKLFTSFLLVGAEVRTFQTRLLEVVKTRSAEVVSVLKCVLQASGILLVFTLVKADH